MSSPKKLSLSFRFLRKLGLVGNEEKYGNVSPFGVVWVAFKHLCTLLAYKYCYSGILLERINPTVIRPWLWRKMGVHVGKNVEIFHRVALDYLYADKLFIEDDVTITNGCTLLCHQRNFDNYYLGENSIRDLPYIGFEVHIKKGCFIGMNTTVLPGVTIGEGAVVGAGSVVSKDVPPWTIVAGAPARVVRRIPPREETPEKQGGGLDNLKVFSLSGYGRTLRRAA